MDQMEHADLLALYDWELRRNIKYHDATRQALPGVVRHISRTGESSFVLYSSLDEETVDSEIEAQVAYFEGIGSDFEWKVFNYDSPPDLCQRLDARGFEIDEPESVMVLDLGAAPKLLFKPITAKISRIEDASGVGDVAIIEESVWHRDFEELTARLRRELRDIPDTLGIYVAYVDGEPASTAWVYYHPRTSFASLWGGSTVEHFRSHGLYTSLLAVRAQEAKARGFRYLTVDASPMSQPILERHGFVTIARARACTWQVGTDEEISRGESHE